MREKYYPEEPDTSETSIAEWYKINTFHDDLIRVDIPMVTTEQIQIAANKRLRRNRYDPHAPDDNIVGSWKEGDDLPNSRLSWNKQFEAMNRVFDQEPRFKREYFNALEEYYLP
jgi:hypothetical protein